MKTILVTNDDGINSPGILAAAVALLPLGRVVVVAPREQHTSTGRSFPSGSDGVIRRNDLVWQDRVIEGWSVGGSPAQTVQHALLEILPNHPDLTVSGINYGENVGSGVTISGTVGAALESASMGIPAMAVSLQMLSEGWYDYEDLDFSAAAWFTAHFAGKVLAQRLPFDADLLKIEIPADATCETPWRVVRQSRHRYYIPYLIRESSQEQKRTIGARIDVNPQDVEPNSDVRALYLDREVAVTPMSIDMTARINLEKLAGQLGG